MNLIILISCNFIAGAAIAHFIQEVLPDYWEYAFKKHSALEADEMQDAWYENEQVIYAIIILFGYVFMILILFAFFRGRILKLIT